MDNDLKPTIRKPCVICSEYYANHHDPNLSSNLQCQLVDKDPNKLTRAFKLFCKLLGLKGSGIPDKDDDVGGNNDGGSACSNRLSLLETNPPPCCDECRKMLLSLLQLEETIEQTQVHFIQKELALQRKQLESLKASFILKPAPSDDSTSEIIHGDEVWIQIRNKLISNLASSSNQTNEGRAKTEITKNLETDCKENIVITVPEIDQLFEPVPIKRRRGRPSSKQSFEENQTPTTSSSRSKSNVSVISDTLLRNKIKPCSIVLQRLKGYGSTETEKKSQVTKNNLPSFAAVVDESSTSPLGVRRSKLKAYNTIRKSLHFTAEEEDCERSGNDSSNDNDDFVPEVEYDNSITGHSDSDEIGDEDDDEEEDDDNNTKKRNSIKTRTGRKKKSNPKKRLPKTNQTRVKPVLMLGNNLLIFRSSVFKHTPGVNFICQAPGCSTVVDGTDYFAFQAIKSHIRKNHAGDGLIRFTKPRPCPLCNKNFKGCKQLNEHLTLKHGPIFTVCEVCWKPLIKSNVRSHLWLHKNEQEKAAVLAAGETCPQQQKEKETCKKITKSNKMSAKKVNMDSKTQSATKSSGKKARVTRHHFLMSIGSDLFLYKNTLIKNTPGSFSCQGTQCTTVVDGTDYFAFQKIKDHVDSFHLQDIIPSCPLCGLALNHPNKSNRQLITLRNHLSESHSSVDCSFICECCWRPLKISLNLHGHMWSHKNDEEKAAAEAAGEQHSWRHLNPKPPKAIELPCAECGKIFYTKHLYTAHQITHLPKELRKQFECTECGLKLLSERALRWHIERIHRPELATRPRICPICDRRFHQADGYKFRSHVRSHTGERPFQCHVCGAAFTTNNQLKRHGNVHNPASRVFQCEFCEMSYKYSSNLKRHRQSAHKDLVAPRDPEMVRNFTALEYRSDFIGPKIAYPCLHCDKVFPLRSRMTKHVKAAHASELVPNQLEQDPTPVTPSDVYVDDDDDDMKVFDC